MRIYRMFRIFFPARVELERKQQALNAVRSDCEDYKTALDESVEARHNQSDRACIERDRAVRECTAAVVARGRAEFRLRVVAWLAGALGFLAVIFLSSILYLRSRLGL